MKPSWLLTVVVAVLFYSSCILLLPLSETARRAALVQSWPWTSTPMPNSRTSGCSVGVVT